MYDPDTQAPPAPSLSSQQQTNQNNTGSIIAGSSKISAANRNGYSGGARPGDKRRPLGKQRDYGVKKNKGQNWQQKLKQRQQQAYQQKPWKPTPMFAEQPDPRDEEYWQNHAALTAMLGEDLAYLQAGRTMDDARYNLENTRMGEWNRRNQRDMAEARLGSGAMYSGSHRRDQREREYDYMLDSERRRLDKQARDAEFDIEELDLKRGYNQSLQEAEAEGMGRALERYDQESLEADGEYAASRPKYGRQIKGANQQVNKIREQLANAKGEKQKERLRKRLRQVQLRRATLKGKARRLRTEEGREPVKRPNNQRRKKKKRK